ncbi:SoxR reducing system RseC family protein [bacterium]|nr:SoxR reducing system RseC family protein [bacterium]
MANSRVSHEGMVIKVDEGKVSVRIEVKSACSACRAKSMCSVSELSEKVIEAIPAESVSVGDSVVVEMEERFGLKAVFYVFFIPFVLMASTLFVSSNFVAESLAALFSLLILVPYYFLLALLKSYFAKRFVFVCRKL